MKIVAVADLHGFLPRIPPCDLLIVAGDLCGKSDLVEQHRFLSNQFTRWLERTKAKRIVGIAGNHDWIYQKGKPPDLPWIYLQDSFMEIEGFKVYGSPWQPRFLNWAFNLDEPELKEKWELIPGDTDILVTHGPPRGFGDKTMRGERAGSPSLRDKVLEIEPKLHVFGHIHEGRGKWQVGKTMLVNATIVNVLYQNIHNPVKLEISS